MNLDESVINLGEIGINNKLKKCDNKDFIVCSDYKEKIMKFEEAILSRNDVKIGFDSEETMPIEHLFGDGLYIRKIFMPKGVVLTSRIHKYKHPYFVLSGKAEISTDDGIIIIEAPHYGITEVGTKRALKILEDMVWITVHRTSLEDPEDIVNEVTSKSFDELENIIDIEPVKEIEM